MGNADIGIVVMGLTASMSFLILRGQDRQGKGDLVAASAHSVFWLMR